jgi:hypothetical protein
MVIRLIRKREYKRKKIEGGTHFERGYFFRNGSYKGGRLY